MAVQPAAVVVEEEEEDDSATAGSPNIIDLDRICRTCLVERDRDGLKDLFEFGLAETVTSVVSGITIEESDGLPGHICLECLQEVERIIGFRQQCERSDATIRNLIEKSVVIKQDSETKYEVLNVVLTDANGNTETSAVVVPVEELRFQLVNGAGGNASEETELVAPADLLVTEEIIVQSQPEEPEIVYEEAVQVSEEEQDQQQESTVLENLRQELSEFIGGTCAEIPQDDQNLDEDVANEDDELIHVDYLKDALTDEYIQTMEQQLAAPQAPQRSEDPAQDRLEQANLDSLINDEVRVGGEEGAQVQELGLPDGKGYRCEDCRVDFEDGRKFRAHMKKHSEKRYECGYCSHRFAEQSQLQKHVVRHAGEKPFGCDLCPKRFATKSLLNTHIKCHLGQKNHICGVCSKGFTLSWQLKAHTRIHTNEKPYECPFCHKRFNQNGNLVIHKRIHTGERPFQCELCERAYPSQGELSAHMRQHTGEKKAKNVTCTVCQKNFAGNGDLKIHMRTHTKEKPYSCQICPKSFMLQVHLTVHMRTHTGEKPFACTLCEKAFSTNHQLKIHTYVHTGEKNFVCELCDRRFSSVANRNTHRKTHERKIS